MPNPYAAGQPWRLPAPEPYRGPDPCPGCAGQKISGEQVMLTPGRRTLLIDCLCTLCQGCGSSQHLNPDDDPDNSSDNSPDDDPDNSPDNSPDDDPDDDPDNSPDDDPDDSPDGKLCCGGRGWFPATAWSTRDPNLAVTLRVPCGCSEQLLVQAEAGHR